MCANDDSGFCEWNGPPEKPPPDGAQHDRHGMPTRQCCFEATVTR